MLKKVLFSEKDEAGRNIADILGKEFDIPCTGFDDSILFLDDSPEKIPAADLFIVASRHKSGSGTPSLTVHSTGNYLEAGAGGKSKQLAYAPALYLSEAIHFLKENPVPGYEACLEVTHHGPTSITTPLMFVEVGSSEKEWADLGACRAIARTISHILEGEPREVPSAIGFGGGHYCRKFSTVSDYALGHICPKYHLQDLDIIMLEEMISKTVPRPKVALIEKKGVGSFKDTVLSLVKEKGLEAIFR